MLPNPRFPAVVTVLAMLAGMVWAQTPVGDMDWRPGVHVERSIDKSGSDTIRIPLAAHQFVRIEAIQKGIDFGVTLRDPQGHELMRADSMNGRYGPETVMAVAVSSGDYTVDVKAGDPSDLPARYELRVVDLREAQPSDQDIVAAHGAYAAAIQLWAQHAREARSAATQKLESSLDFFRHSGDRYMHALTLFSLGTAVAESGDYRKAVPLFQNASEVFHALTATHEEADSINSLAGAFDVLGEPQPALRQYEQALNLFHATGDQANEAILFSNIGWTQSTLANWQAALDDYRQSLDLLRKSANDQWKAHVLANMGVAYRQLGDQDQAERFFTQSLPLWKQLGDRRGEATTLDALANMFIDQNEPAKALPVLERAVAAWRASGDKRGLAEALAFTARAQTNLGRFDAAQASVAESLDLAHAVRDRHLTGIALVELARTDLLSSQPDKAAETSEQALVEFRAIGDRTDQALSLETIARAESDRGHLSRARQSLEEALRLTEQNRGATNSDQLRASFFATRQDSYAFYVDVLMRMGDTAAALQANERSRARSLLDMLAASGTDVREGVDPKLLARERELSDRLNAKGSRLLPLLGRNDPEHDPQAAALSAEIRDLQSEYQDVETAIRRASPRYAALTQPQPLTLAEIQKQVLDPDTLLLEYSLGAKTSWLWTVSQDQLQAFQLPPRAAIEEQATRVYELLATHRPDAELAPEIRKLSDMVLAPATSVLGEKRLAIVADGPLQRIPFALLAASERPREIAMLPSASAIAALRTQTAGRAPASKLLAVFADPVFDSSDPRAHGQPVVVAQALEPSASRLLEHLAVAPTGSGDAHLRIPRLPFTSQEADAILSVAHDPSDLKATGFEASRAEALSGVLGQYRYLHFATHGYLDTERPELSALVLSQFDERGRPVDGFLRVNDIYNSRLSADLVVLSACQTGLGKEVRGEGLMGLTRAFLYAGVPRVIVSLWSVDDRATAELMAAFYRSLLRDHKRPSEALVAAQQELRKHKEWQAPYYWAAFVQQGDWK